jgi:transposase
MQQQGTKIDFSGQNIYVGIDTHLKSWKVALYYDTISLKTFTQDPDPGLLANHLRKNYPNANYHCAYEAGFSGFWLQKALAKEGIDCIVVNPADIPTTDKEKKFKTDKRDCRKIARSLCNRELEAIYVPTDDGLEDRSVVRLYKDMIKNRTRYKNKIKSILNFYGISYPKEYKTSNGHWTTSFCKWLESIHLNTEDGTWMLNFYIQEYLHSNELVKKAKKQLQHLSEQKKYSTGIKLLRSIPGIGLVAALTILTEIEDINRFKTLDELCSYIGLVPNTNSSGDTDRIGSMTHRGNSFLKTVIIEAAWMSLRYDPGLLFSYQKLKSKMNSNKAIIRIAKKLVNRIRFVLRNGVEYKKSVL